MKGEEEFSDLREKEANLAFPVAMMLVAPVPPKIASSVNFFALPKYCLALQDFVAIIFACKFLCCCCCRLIIETVNNINLISFVCKNRDSK